MGLTSIVGRSVMSFSLTGIAGVYTVLQELWIANVGFGMCPVQMASYSIALTVPIVELAIVLFAVTMIPRRFSFISQNLKRWTANIGSALIGILEIINAGTVTFAPIMTRRWLIQISAILPILPTLVMSGLWSLMFLNGLAIFCIFKHEGCFGTSFAKQFPGIDLSAIRSLQVLGISSLEQLAAENAQELAQILQYRVQIVENWIYQARRMLHVTDLKEISATTCNKQTQRDQELWFFRDKSLGEIRTLRNLPGCDAGVIKILHELGVYSMKELVMEDARYLAAMLNLSLELIEEWVWYAQAAINNRELPTGIKPQPLDSVDSDVAEANAIQSQVVLEMTNR